MPIIDIQRRLAQTGRIRIGEVVVGENAQGKKYTRPKKSETFRLTSSNEAAIRAVAVKYGGTPRPWEDAPTSGQWELMTTSTTLDILIPPEAVSFSQYYELWSGGGCQRRCNGAFQVPSEEDCVCDPNARECKPHTRLSVMLADLTGAGLWRLDTQGWNAANELSGAFELAQMISKGLGTSLLPGVLRLDQRETKRPDANGKPVTRKFAVPVIDFAVNLGELARGTQVELEAPRGPITPVAFDEEAPSLADQLESVNHPVDKPKRANSAEPVRPTGIAVRPRGAIHEDDEPVVSTSARSAPERPVGDVSFETFKTGFNMLDNDEKNQAIAGFEELQLPHRFDSWDANQLRAGLDVVDKILNALSEPLEDDHAPVADENGEVVTEDIPVDTVRVNANDILPPRATKNKITQLNIRFVEAGYDPKDRDTIHAYAAKVIGLPNVKSLNELTTPQANHIIDQLLADIEASA